jgi:hypothetical protein
MVGNDKLFNASFFIVGEEAIGQALHRMIPSTPSGIWKAVLTPAVKDRFAQSYRLPNHCA